MNPTNSNPDAGHTKGPWDYIISKTLIHIETRHDNPVGAGILIFSVPKNKEANASRIVECVNAMEGVKDPAAFKASHDGLLAALEETLEAIALVTPDAPEPVNGSVIHKARSAIAAATEAQP